MRDSECQNNVRNGDDNSSYGRKDYSILLEMKMALRGYSIGQEGVMNERRYERTMYACFIGYIVQAIVNNFVTLLFLTFEKSYHIPLGKITMLITINFGTNC